MPLGVPHILRSGSPGVGSCLSLSSNLEAPGWETVAGNHPCMFWFVYQHCNYCSGLISQLRCLSVRIHAYIYIHTYICIYIYMCVCVCVNNSYIPVVFGVKKICTQVPVPRGPGQCALMLERLWEPVATAFERHRTGAWRTCMVPSLTEILFKVYEATGVFLLGRNVWYFI